jgi:hypothetical protein
LAVVRPLAGFDSGARGGVGKTLFHDFYPGATICSIYTGHALMLADPEGLAGLLIGLI